MPEDFFEKEFRKSVRASIGLADGQQAQHINILTHWIYIHIYYIYTT